MVRGNCTFPRSFGEGQGARVTPALAGSSHSSTRETLEPLSACSLARSLTLSLLEQRSSPSVGEDVPSVHEVLREARFVLALVVRVFF